MNGIGALLTSGAGNLAAYLAAHVLLCLVPAFFIAGALSALVPQQSILRFLGPAAPKYVSYTAAAGAGSLLRGRGTGNNAGWEVDHACWLCHGTRVKPRLDRYN